ncbi:MAG: hypothetical protein HY908_09435, partial [Myxococcales bacterium]|nr:hypothetical protein [Myxococcales bacterium]
RALAGDGARPEHERLYLRARVWGHHLAASDRSLELALRDRAVRMLLARALARTDPGDGRDDAALRGPLAAVEMLMRGGGLDHYARALAHGDGAAPSREVTG